MTQKRRRVALDRPQRRAQLVRDRAQELGLHAIELLQSRYLARLVEQVQVVDGQRGMVRQRYEQALVSRRPRVRNAAFQVHHPDDAPLEHHRHG